MPIADAQQAARFRVLEEQLERCKLELLMRARQSPLRDGNHGRQRTRVQSTGIAE